MRKKLTIGVLAASAVIVAVYVIINMERSAFVNALINGLSLAGIINVAVALFCHVRNGGQFRILGYPGYKKHIKAVKADLERGLLPTDTKLLTFNEYSDEKYKKRWDPIPFYICGIPMIVLSLVLMPFWK